MPESLSVTPEDPPPLSSELRLALEISEDESNNEIIHKAIVRQIVKSDLLTTLLSIADDLEIDQLSPEHIPPSIYKAMQDTSLEIPKRSEEEFSFPSSSEQDLEIAQYSTYSAESFKRQAEETKNLLEKERYQIMAAEARLIPTIFVDGMVRETLDKGGNEGWDGNKIKVKEDGLPLSQLRRQYFTGTIDNLSDYDAFKKAVEGSSLSPMAELMLDLYKKLKAFGIDSFQDFFNMMGQDKVSVKTRSEWAVSFFQEDNNQEILEEKIKELVKEGGIPEVHQQTFAAFALAARLLDEEDGREILEPKEMLKRIAEKEGIKYDDEDVRFLGNQPVAIPSTALLALIDAEGKSAVGATLLLPEGMISRHVTHEVAHIIHGLFIRKISPLLAAKLPSQAAERIATYLEYKYGGGFTRYARLSASRYVLLTEAQLAHIDELDAACESENLEEIERILRDSLKTPTENMEKTFGETVAGETYGYPFGILGLYAHASSLVEGDLLKPLTQIIKEAITIT